VSNGDLNKLYPEDRAVHEWYRFVLSFPPHLVRRYLQRFEMGAHHRLLDPFRGTGTRQILQILEPHSVDAVMTSPPYPDEKDYTRWPG
jgi:hypothetical protein